MYKVKIENRRPDFRVFIDLLYGNDKNIDTDGDSIPVYSRDWKELFMQERKMKSSSITILSNDENQKSFEVTSKYKNLEEVTALYLYEYCGSSIENNSRELSSKEINNLKNKFSLELQRARKSIWHKSNENNPYPNLV